MKTHIPNFSPLASDAVFNSSLLQNARQFAIDAHADTNHKYDQHPYSYHLQMVVNAAMKYIYLIPYQSQETVLAACWCHDVIEDARQTYNDVKKITNEEVAELAFALTNDKGRSRSDRAGESYYEGIRNTPFAVFIKICDRIANAEHSANTNSRMYEVYRKENENFMAKLYDKRYEPLIKHLCMVLNTPRIGN